MRIIKRVIFLMIIPINLYGAPLLWIWDSSYRGDIKVYLCIDTFTNWLPQLNQSQLVSTLKNVLDIWNIYGGVDFRLNYSGYRYGTANGCDPFSWPSPGELTVYAYQHCNSNNTGCVYGCAFGDPPVTMNKAFVRLARDCNSEGTPINWSFDYRNDSGPYADVATVLLHEIGHTLGFNHDCYSRVSVMDPGLSTSARVLWPQDIYYLTFRRPCEQCASPCDGCTTSCSLIQGYSRVLNRQILHKRSTDNGDTWVSEGNLLEYTNSKMGITFREGSNYYLLAWKTPSGGDESISTILGNGVSYWDKVSNIGETQTFAGPSVAYGNGIFILVWVTSLNDERRIWYKTSTDGVNWSAYNALYFRWYSTDIPQLYGSMWEPIVAYMSNKDYFITGWTQWRYDHNFSRRGEVSVCLNRDPSSEVWYYCRGLGVYSNSSPSIICHSSQNKCLVSWTEHTGINDYRIKYAFATIITVAEGDKFDFSTRIVELTERTNTIPSLAYGNLYWLLGWRGNDANTTGNTMRRLDGDGGFTTKRYPDTLLQPSPTLVYGSLWKEFAFYYTKR